MGVNSAGSLERNPLLDVVHDEGDLLVVNKPAGLVCHPTKGDEFSSLISRARLYCNRREMGSPQLINRLDRETSGIVLIATSEARAAEMRLRWERGEVAKTYLAIVEGDLAFQERRIDLPIGQDEASPVAIKGCVRVDGAASVTEIRRIAQFARADRTYTVIHAFPLTGRKHQIRIHLAHVGHPLVGDKLYGHDERCYLDFVMGRLTLEQRARLSLENHALHSEAVEWNSGGLQRKCTAPVRDEMRVFMGSCCV